MGTIGFAIPKVRDGSYFPSLLEPRRRAERALLAVVHEAYVLDQDQAGRRPQMAARSTLASRSGDAHVRGHVVDLDLDRQ